MAKLTIIGNATPEIGKQHQYSISSLGLNTIQYNNPFSSQKPIETKWEIYVLENGKWRKTTGTAKYGDAVSYTFTQKSLTREGIILKATRGEDSGELSLKAKRASTPKIIKIDLLDVNGKKVVKPLSYMDTLVVKAYCTDMDGQKLHFTLWEDDAIGPGHNTINEKNKINLFPVSATVKKGIAEARFNMAQYTMASKIANMQMAKGDKDEGKNHEYYVTAEYFGKLKASNNVNIKNPEYKPNAGTEQKKVPNKKPAPETPKKDTYKTPISSGSKNKNIDRNGKIVRVSFVDENGNPITNFKTSSGVIAKIETKNMIGKSVKLTIWEEDTLFNDKIWSDLVKIVDDVCYQGIPITNAMWKKGDDGGDSVTQEYFLEVEYAGSEMKSAVVTVDNDTPMTKVETGKSEAYVSTNEKSSNNETECFCKKNLKDLIWGNKVSCEFRKKVIEISKRQNIDPNNFMAAMAHETGGTFDPTCGTFKKHKNESREGYVGLLQIGKDAAKDIGITRTELLKLTSEKQLDYMEKYLALPNVKGKLKTLTDFYLAVLFPVDCGKGSQANHIVFDNSLPITYYANGQPIKNLNYWRNVAYKANPAFHKEGKDEKGKTYVWEIAENIKKWYKDGENNKVKIFSCEAEQSLLTKLNAKGVITYHIYSDGKIEKHTPRVIKTDYEKKYKYVYHDKNNLENVLGVFSFKETEEMKKGNTAGTNKIKLVDIREFKGYSSNGIKLKFLTLNTESGRYFINPDCYAGLLGAMAEMNINYLGFNGFSNFQGKSTGGSSSHRNGEKGDLRYLSRNKKGEATILQDAHFDVETQNKFNDALYKFGWGRLEKMYSEYFKYKGKLILLNHTKDMKKLGKGGYRHYHHLHLSGFDHSLIKKINEK